MSTAKAVLASGQQGLEPAHHLIDESKDILSFSLDAQVRVCYRTDSLSLTRPLELQYKSTVTDPAISRSLASYWEERFFHDMHRLRVRDPDTLTRVTEYVPEIAAFVERIIANGFAYEAEGSVYFDTQTFDAAEGHDYAKLEPWSKGNRELLEGGEGNV